MSSESMSDEVVEPFIIPPPPSSPVPDSPTFVPATPESESDVKIGQDIKYFNIQKLPGDIIRKLCDYWTLDEIFKMKYGKYYDSIVSDSTMPRCKHLRKYCTKYPRHNWINIINMGDLSFYRSPGKRTCEQLMSEVKEVQFEADFRYDNLSYWYSNFQLHTVKLQTTWLLNHGLSQLFNPSALRVLTLSSVYSSEFLDMMEQLGKNYPNLECIEIRDCKGYGKLELNLVKRPVCRWPNLRVIKFLGENGFLRWQSQPSRLCVRMPKLEEIHEENGIWKWSENNKWQMETDVAEIKVNVVRKRKFIDLEPKEIKNKCSKCGCGTGKKQKLNQSQLCLACIMGPDNNHNIGNRNLIEFLEENKAQLKCCTCVTENCECVFILEEKTVAFVS